MLNIISRWGLPLSCPFSFWGGCLLEVGIPRSELNFSAVKALFFVSLSISAQTKQALIAPTKFSNMK